MKQCLLFFLLCIPLFAKENTKALAVFISNPESRKVKSRIAADCSQKVADTFYAYCLDILTEDLMHLENDFEICLALACPSDESWARENWPSFRAIIQPQKPNLGDRIQCIINNLLEEGYESVILIGSDTPSLPLEYILAHQTLLDQSDAVLGPAEDGGFYLIGTNKNLPSLQKVRWSSKYAYEDTRLLLASHGLSLDSGPKWYDIDHLADFEKLSCDLVEAQGARLALANWLQRRPKVSIVIPVLNEEKNIHTFIDHLNVLIPKPELIFVDGGSRDQTAVSIAARGERVLGLGRPNRGAQMNYGANVAQSEILLFLHADSWLSQASYTQMLSAFKEDPELIGGAFTHAFQNRERDWRLRCIDWGIKLRNTLFCFPYGDQGFFVQKNAWQEYQELPLMEDIEWFGRLKQTGKMRILSATLETSPRRLYQKGCFRTCINNLRLVLLYKLRVSPKKLARAYYSQTKPEDERL